jgi:nitrate/nitrite transporter NarK
MIKILSSFCFAFSIFNFVQTFNGSFKVGLVVAVVPGILVPRIGTKRSVVFLMMLHAVALLSLGAAKNVSILILSLIVLSIGASGISFFSRKILIYMRKFEN